MGGTKKSKKRKRSGLRQLILLFFVLSVLGGVYYYVKIYSHDDTAPLVVDNAPQYTVLENTDSIKYLTAVIYKNNVSINSIATTFYNNEIFWPYIYIENKEVITNPLNISKDVVIRIPRLSDKILNINDTTNFRITKNLVDSILNEVTYPI